jgi:hypothetical protein
MILEVEAVIDVLGIELQSNVVLVAKITCIAWLDQGWKWQTKEKLSGCKP